LFDSRIYDRYSEADTVMALREVLLEQCAQFLTDYPESPRLLEVRALAREMLAEYINLQTLRQYGERSGRMYEKFCHLVGQHYTEDELKNLVPQFYGAEFGFNLSNYTNHPNWLKLKELAAKHQTYPAALLCKLNLHHLGYAPEQARLYDDFIRAFAPQDIAKVALRKVVLPLVEKKDWTAAATVYAQYRPVFAGEEKYMDSHLALLRDPDDRRELKNLGPAVNSKNRDYNPVLSLDGQLLYFSRRSANTGEDVFFSFQDGKGQWTPAQPLDKKVNTGSHEVPLSLSPDGNTLYLYGNYAALPEFYYVLPGNKLGKGDLFYAERQGPSWSRLYALPYPVNTPHFEAGLCQTADGQALLFSSDRPGGVGGHFPNYHPEHLYYHGAGEFNLDIYVSLKTPQGWGEPINLGQVINTPYAEINPWLHPDMKTLYFCSDGHPGLGGYDIYMTKRLRDDSWAYWSEPVNLGKAINSGGNDSFYMTTDGQSALVTSTQKNDTHGSSDIYWLRVPPAYRPEPVTVVAGRITGPDGKGLKTKVRWQLANAPAEGKPPVASPPPAAKTGLATSGELITDEVSGTFTIALRRGHKYVYYAEHPDYFGASVEVDLTDGGPSSPANGLKTNDPKPGPAGGAAKTGPAPGGKPANLGQLPAGQPGLGTAARFDTLRVGYLQPGLKGGASRVGGFTLPTLHFGHDSDEIRPESFFDLDRLAAALQRFPEAKLSIEGHTDEVGKDDFNLALSQRRAEAVRRYLVGKGCRAAITAQGYGETRPLAANTTEAGRQANRRVEFKVQ
jgi:outer membrane protein OmpA-like peptidoglycan-associated protein